MANISIQLLGLEALNAEISGFLITFTDEKKMHKAGLEEFFRIEEEIFNDEGGKRTFWPELSAKYAIAKLRSQYSGMPMMQRTGALKNALTGKDPSKLQIVNTGFGIQVYILSPYWRRHQFGLNMPKRETVVLTAEDKRKIEKVMLDATLGGKLTQFFARS